MNADYLIGYDEAVQIILNKRSTENEAAFVLPF